MGNENSVQHLYCLTRTIQTFKTTKTKSVLQVVSIPVTLITQKCTNLFDISFYIYCTSREKRVKSL